MLAKANKADTKKLTEKGPLLATVRGPFLFQMLKSRGSPQGGGWPLYTHFAKGGKVMRTALRSCRVSQPEFVPAVIDKVISALKARDAQLRVFVGVRPVLGDRSCNQRADRRAGKPRDPMSWVRAKSASQSPVA